MNKEYVKELIKEQINNIILQQEFKSIDDVKTIGDLKQFLLYVGKTLSNKQKAKAGMKARSTLIKATLTFIPFLSAGRGITDVIQAADDLKSIAQVILSINPPDHAKKYKFKTNSILQKFFHIDPSLSNILEDAVQKSFLQHLGKYLSTLSDNDPIPDLSDLLRNFVNNNFLIKSKQSKLQKFNQGIIRQASAEVKNKMKE